MAESDYLLTPCPCCGVKPRPTSRLVGEGYDDCVFKVYRIECECGLQTKWCESELAAFGIWRAREGAEMLTMPHPVCPKCLSADLDIEKEGHPPPSGALPTHGKAVARLIGLRCKACGHLIPFDDQYAI